MKIRKTFIFGLFIIITLTRCSTFPATAQEQRLTGPTNNFRFTAINGGTEYSVSAGTVVEGTVNIPAYYRPNTDSDYLPVKEIDSFRASRNMIRVIIPSSVRSINERAFEGCINLNNITISTSVTSIGKQAFSGCTGLIIVTIPNNVTSIGEGVFSGCTSLASITLPFVGGSLNGTTNTNFGFLFGASSSYYQNQNYSIPESLKTVVITGGSTISDGAFFNCANLTAITIPEGVTVIGERAFSGCTGLTSITIPTSVTTIGGNAFQGCANLTAFTIPANVTSIGNNMFSGCTSLIAITAAAGNPNYTSQDGILYNIAKTTFVIIPPRISGSITIPAGITSIDQQAFSGCTNLNRITIPASVTSIGNKAFQGCTGLTTFTFSTGSQLKSIGDAAFGGCTGITAITIPANVESIGQQAFSGCTGLTTITVPTSVTSIGERAFEGCTGFTSITLPFVGGSLNGTTNTSLGYLFGASSSYYQNQNSSIPESLKTVIITGGSSIGGRAFSGCTNLTTITIPASITLIGNFAFQGCINLNRITIPAGVTTIGQQAFSGCTSIAAITIPAGVISIGYQAFGAWTSLQTINIRGKANQAAADAAWGGSGWRDNCNARIVYQR